MSTKSQRERWAKEKAERTKKFLTNDWDGEAANDYFSNMCDSNPLDKFWGKPSGEPFDGLRQIHLAENDIYCEVQQSAYAKEKLINKLKLIIGEDVLECGKTKTIKYCEARKSISQSILAKIMNGEFPFQINK